MMAGGRMFLRRWQRMVCLGLACVAAGAGMAEAPPAEGAVIPITLSRGRPLLSGAIGEVKGLTFLLDSACTIPTLHPTLVDELKIEPSGRVRIVGIAGEERAPTYRNVAFDFGGARYAPRRVASIPSERAEARRRDGVIGSGFFREFVIELDAKAATLRLTAPTNFAYAGRGTVVPFSFRAEIPVLKASLAMKGREAVEGEFELDTGCDSGICVGQPFLTRHGLLSGSDGKRDEKFGVGGSVATHNTQIPTVRLAGLEATDVQADYFLEGSPVDEPLAGHIGMGFLRRYKVIFDYTRQRLILEEPASSVP